MKGDAFVLEGVHSTIKYHITTSDKPVYLYRFSVDTPNNLFKLLGNMLKPGK